MHTLKVAQEVAERLAKFTGSNLFSTNDFAKSPYWRDHSEKLKFDIRRDSVGVSGQSGFYIPNPASPFKRVANKLARVAKDPSLLIRKVTGSLRSTLGVPRLLSSQKAFDAVMSHAQVADIDDSPYRINHLNMAGRRNVLMTSKEVANHYKAWSNYAPSDSIINHYYHQNVLSAHIEKRELRTILEIGAGNGNLASILFHDWAPVRVVIVDLPEMLAISIPFISHLFPNASIVMPHEVAAGGLRSDFDFAFLTVAQLDQIEDNSMDLAMNCDSFQEMTGEWIGKYFQLVQRVVREEGFFFTVNRVEKIPVGNSLNEGGYTVPPNRFSEYPWDKRNEILLYEISRFNRLVQLDGCFLRLERVHKN